MALAVLVGCQEPTPSPDVRAAVAGASTTKAAPTPTTTTLNSSTAARPTPTTAASARRRAKPSESLVDRWGHLQIRRGIGFAADGRFDVLVHFHGGGAYTRARKARLDAVVVSASLGHGSAKYRELFSDGYTLAQARRSIERAVRRQTGFADARIGRLALSSFSAGYGAISNVLRDPQNDRWIDAVLIADGMHADLRPTKAREVLPMAMAGYARYADAATHADKLMVVSYSQIPTDKFASAAESANFLIRELALEERSDCRRSKRLWLQTCHGRGSLRLLGYAGTEESDHMNHLYDQHRTMYRTLRKHWRK